MEVTVFLGKLYTLAKTVFEGLTGFAEKLIDIASETITWNGTDYSVLSVLIGAGVGVLITISITKWVL